MKIRLILWLGLLLVATVLKAQCPGNTIADTINLVFNGDFEQGNTGFTSQYAYCNTANCLWPEATYAVGTNASFFHNNFVGVDHTTGSGNFMIVNGSSQPNTNVWCQTINVTPNTTYQFSAWVQSCVTSNPAILQFRINGSLIGSSFTAPGSLNQWAQFYSTWNSGTSTTATICIVNQNTATSGNDFGLDDIVFTACIPCQISQATAIGDTTVCPGAPVTLLATADTPATFTWSPASTLSNPNLASPVATTNTTTVYTVTATDSVGCTQEDTVTVTINNAPPFTLPEKDTLCLGDTATINLQATAPLQYQWQPNQAISCTTCQQPDVYPTSSQWYTVTVTGQYCTSVDSIFIQVADTPAMSAGPDRILCNLPFTQLQGSYTGITPLQSILWTPPTGLSHTTLLNPIANPVNTTTYTLTITTIFGCARSDEVNVIRSVAIADAGPDTAICAGDTVQIGAPAQPKTSYQWQPSSSLDNDTLAQPLAFPGQSTIYTLTITDSNGCNATDFMVITIAPPPTVSLAHAGSLCVGDSTTITASGAASYVWQPGTNLSCSTCAVPLVFPTQTTTYTVIGTNAAGCTDSQTTTLTVHPSPVITASAPSPICAGDTAVLQAQGAQSYVWSPANSLDCTICPAPQATPIGSTTYSVIGTDANGCSDSATVTIQTQNGPPISVSADTTICPGTAVGLQVTGGSTYSWTPANSLSCGTCANPTAQPAQTTTYTITAFNPIGCNSVDTVRVVLSGINSAGITGDTAICPGDTANWQVQGLAQLTWSPATGISCQTCPTPSLFPTQTTTYTLTGIDNQGCQILPVTKTLLVTPKPVLTLSAPDTVCAGTNVSIVATGAPTYQWTSTASLSCHTCPNPSVVLQQSSTFQVRGTSAGGCFVDTSLTVAVQPAPSLSLTGNTFICPGDSALLQLSTSDRARWQPDPTLACDTCTSTWVYPNQSQWYTAIASSPIGCSTLDSIFVTLYPPPAVIASPDTQVCLGEPVQLQAMGAVSYTWSPANMLSCISCANPVALPLQDQWFVVSGTDSNGCTAADSVLITLTRLTGLTISSDTLICLGDTITLTASGASQYTWSPATGLAQISGPTVTAYPTDTIQYTVLATDANGCAQDTTVTVYVHQPLPVLAAPDTAVCPGESVRLLAYHGSQYSWLPANSLSDPTIATPLATPAQTTIYTVTKWDTIGCTRTETVRVAVHPQPLAEAGPPVTINEGATHQLTGSGGGQYSWQPVQWLSDPTIANPIAAPIDSTWFYLTTLDNNGCWAIDSVLIGVLPNVKIMVPTAFTPNGDGHNDLFGIGYAKGVIVTRLQVFDRWGQEVFSATTAAETWDGSVGGSPAPAGVYIWIIQGLENNGIAFQRQGNITLLR